MAKRKHNMPFGSQILDDGRVRFRIWAPDAKQVELSLRDQAPETNLAMCRENNGWFCLITELATAGTCYQFRIDNERYVPDPASRFQLQDVHGASQVIDPCTWDWKDIHWRGRPWEDVVIYELHTGAFTPKGSFNAVTKKLDYLLELGVTAIELMPIADFPGKRNWGYDGTLLFAPDNRYGNPNALKQLIQTAHNKHIMVFLDVVYNHFGPEGNYLSSYAKAFFTDQYHTPWGDAINFNREYSSVVRRFFLHNALYWLEEYNLDGLRLDSVHAIFDNSAVDILEQLVRAVQQGPGRDRHIHLMLENDNNTAHYLRRSPEGKISSYAAQWNDDIHHALHVLLTGEKDGYYVDYAQQPIHHLGRSLTEGFSYQGETSVYRHGKRRGETSAHLPPTAFISFLQNHDQIGNRALGDRITERACAEAVRAATAIVLLSPSTPLLFMGQEWAAETRFPYFCDFEPELNQKVKQGRLKEFEHFTYFNDPQKHIHIPDPTIEKTFKDAVLNWQALDDPPHRAWFDFHYHLLQLRRRYITPRLPKIRGQQSEYSLLASRALSAQWRLGDESLLYLYTNMSHEPADIQLTFDTIPFYASHTELAVTGSHRQLPPWSVIWLLAPGAQ